jgi:hypothetical protein
MGDETMQQEPHQDVAATEADKPAIRADYSPPKLTVYGPLEGLTAGSIGENFDGPGSKRN